MKKYSFSTAETVAVWEYYGKKCAWCEEPLSLDEATVDHVIPEHLVEKPDELAKVLAALGLPKTFSINDYNNWVPCHGRCNQKKSTKIFRPSLMIQALLEKLERDRNKIAANAEKLENDQKADSIIGRVKVALEKKIITETHLVELLGEIRILPAPFSNSIQQAVKLNVDSNRWTIVRSDDESAVVTDGRVGGITPVGSNPHPSWSCPNCGSYGPWNGVICLSCGRMSDPAD